MHHLMFDVDQTLVQSFKFDEQCFVAAVETVLNHRIDRDWASYPHVTDSGILATHFERSGLLAQKEVLQAKVKQVFIDNIKQYLAQNPAKPIAGAVELIAYLKQRSDIKISIATGGWGETARLKLASAGIDITNIVLASANDHSHRIEIMKSALAKTGADTNVRVTYFGDAEWDVKACAQLNWDLVLVGDRVAHPVNVPDFSDLEQVLNLAGLYKHNAATS
ncbi:HAD family hydrolase [Salinibius halmophilus]|uniref:HAD family hydrolase n=1 Tax=Salinibius halmophilus TaxID=1853216 RepID=UPI000E669EF1|nr:HAD hydrolase-like protein [Salinibius halmophilus]